MSAQAANLNTDQSGRLTSGQYADDGTGASDWIMKTRDLANDLRVPGYPLNSTPIQAGSAIVSAANAVATIPAVASKTAYLSSFQVTAGGATAAGLVEVTVSGLLGGTRTFVFGVPAGAAVIAAPLVVTFPAPLPASAANVAIVVTCPSLGAGNLKAQASAQGFYR